MTLRTKLDALIAFAAISAGAALLGSQTVRADFDWSPLIVQWEARTPNISAGGYPPGAAPVTASSGDVAASAAAAALPAAAGKTTWITGFQCTGTGATSAGYSLITISGTITGSMYEEVPVPATATTALTPILRSYAPPIPASAADTAITVSMASLGTGNLHANCNAQGFETALAP